MFSLEKKAYLANSVSVYKYFYIQQLQYFIANFLLSRKLSLENEQKSMNQVIEKDLVPFIILFVLLHVLKTSATWEGGFPVQEPCGVILYQLVDKELSSQKSAEKLNMQKFQILNKYSDTKP